MARSPVTVSEINAGGVIISNDLLGPAWVDGFAMMNDAAGRTFIMCKNDSGAPITLTVQTTATPDGQPVADRTYVVNDGQRLLVGAFNPAVYNQPDSTIYIDFSAVTGVSFGAFKLRG